MDSGTRATVSTAQLMQKLDRRWQIKKEQIERIDMTDWKKLFSHVKCTCIYHSHHQWDERVNPSLFFVCFFQAHRWSLFKKQKNKTKPALSRDSNGVRHSHSLHTLRPASHTVQRLMWNVADRAGTSYTNNNPTNMYRLTTTTPSPR